MKNDMKLIMESWRKVSILSEASPHSNEWLSKVTVGEFMSVMDGDGPLNKDMIGKAVKGAMKQYANEIAELEGEDKKVFNTLLSKVLSAESVEGIAGYGSELATASLTAAGGAAIVAAGAAVAPAAVAMVAVGWLAKKLISHVAKKGIQTALDIGGSLENLDVPDQELANTPAYNLIDISDDYKKVVVGADGELDKQEAAVLAIGFKQVAKALKMIQDQLGSLDVATPEGVEAQADIMEKPMSEYMQNTATVAIQKAYGQMLKLDTSVTITKP